MLNCLPQFVDLNNACGYHLYTHTHTALTGQVPRSRSTGVGVGRCDNSPGLYHCGGGPGKSNSYPSSQQRIPDECGRGRLIYKQSTIHSYIYTFSSLSNFHLHFLSISPPRNVKLSLSTSHISAAPQPGIFSWVSCMATKWCCRSLLLFLPLQLAR